MTVAESPERDPAIVVDHVDKSFPVAYGLLAWIKYRGRAPRRTVLRDVSLRVGRGELLGLLGPNGAGKTTLLKLLATMSIPDRGSISICGIDAAKEPDRAKRKIGLCTSDERSFYFRLTARANLEFIGALMGLRGRALDKRIAEVVELVDLTESLDRRFDSFSSGMRQRLAIARSIIGNPEIIFFDEPTRAVDPVHAEAIRNLIRDELVERQHKTVVLATNLLEEAWQLCDRIAVINKGRIVALGPPDSLDAALGLTARYEISLAHAEEALVDRARKITGVTAVSVNTDGQGTMLTVDLDPKAAALSELLRHVNANGNALREIRFIEPSPADIFRQVTAED